jgi:hypothetical protein
MRKLSLEKSCPVRLILLDKEVSKSIQVLDLNISYSMYTNLVTQDDDGDINAQMEQNTSYCKINMFLDSVCNNAMVIDRGDQIDLDTTVNNFDNTLIVLPMLNESTLLACLHSKLNSISGENTYVDVLKFHDTTEGVTYTYDTSEDEQMVYPELPETQTEWLGDYPYWETSWWKRNDISTYDRGAEEKEEWDEWIKTKSEQNIDQLNRETFNEIETGMAEAFGKSVQEQVTKKGELVEIDFSKKKAKALDNDD